MTCRSPYLQARSVIILYAPRASRPCILHQPQSWDNHSIVHCSILAPCSTRFRFYFSQSSLPSSIAFHNGTRLFAFIIRETEHCTFYTTNCITLHANHSLMYPNYLLALAQMPPNRVPLHNVSPLGAQTDERIKPITCIWVQDE